MVVANGGSISFGLLNFQEALKQATDNFLSQLPNDIELQKNSLRRYAELKNSAKS